MSAGDRVSVGVLVSGRGTNLEALLESAADPSFPASVVLVLSNRANAAGLDVARRFGIEARAEPVTRHRDVEARDEVLRDHLLNAGVQLVVLAGYDRVLSAGFYTAFPNAIINVHPSLLPAFGGSMTGVQEALDYGVKVSGCTVQLLEPGAPDGGPIILQSAVPVLDDDDVDTLWSRVHEQEWLMLPEAVALWSRGRLRLDGRRIRVLSFRMTGEPGVRIGDAIPQEA